MPVTPSLSARKKNIPVKSKPANKKIVLESKSRKTRQSISASIEDQSEHESDNDGEDDDDEDQYVDEAPKVQATTVTKRKRSSANNIVSARASKKAKTAAISNDEDGENGLATEDQVNDAKSTAAIKGEQTDEEAVSDRESIHEGTRPSISSETIPAMLSPPEPSSTRHESSTEASRDSAQASVVEPESGSAMTSPPSDKTSTPILPTILDVKLNDQTIASVPITTPSFVSPPVPPPHSRSQSPSASASAIPISAVPAIPHQLLPAFTSPERDLKTQPQPGLETNTISPNQKKYNTLPPPLPSSLSSSLSSAKRDKILTFAGIPLETAPLTENTLKMTRDGKLRNGVEMDVEDMMLGDTNGDGNGDEGSGRDDRDLNGGADGRDTLRAYEWEM